MSKQIPLTSRANKTSSTNIDAWVGAAPEPKPYKVSNTIRLTFDLDKSVHSKMKIHCATHDISLTDFIRSLIEQAIDRR